MKGRGSAFRYISPGPATEETVSPYMLQGEELLEDRAAGNSSMDAQLTKRARWRKLRRKCGLWHGIDPELGRTLVGK